MPLTLREEILAGRNFDEHANPPNLTRFGGIYFGVSGKILYLKGINFGECHRKSMFNEVF